MKILISVLLIAALVLSLAACTSGKKKDENTKKEEIVCGGWGNNTEFSEITLPEDADKALEKVNAERDGKTLVPVAFLGSQVVGGMNYLCLCLDGEKLVKVKIFSDLNGEAELTSENEVTVSSAEGGEISFPEEILDGAMSYGGAYGGKLPERAEEAFHKATDGITEADFEPIVLLGCQVVAGINYKVLIKYTESKHNIPVLAVATVYADLNGGAALTSVNAFAG